MLVYRQRSPTRWFVTDGAVLRNDVRTWLWARAASAEALDRVREALPGDWLLDEGPTGGTARAAIDR